MAENFWKTEKFLYEIFRHCETTNFWRKIVIITPPMKFCGTVGEYKIDRKMWYPPALLSLTVFDSRNFLKHRRFLRRFFWYCETTKFRKEIVILHSSSSSFLSIMFLMPKFSETQIVSPTSLCGTVRQKIFDGKSWYSPLPQLAIKSFDARNFLEHRRVPLRNFLVVWDETVSAESRETDPLSYFSYFFYP